MFSLAFGYAQDRDLDELGREVFTSRVAISPWGSLSLEAFGAYDPYGRGCEDAELELAYWPIDQLHTALYAHRRVPSLTLPSTSIFSVFGSESHTDAGGARAALSYERLAGPWIGRYDCVRGSLDLPLRARSVSRPRRPAGDELAAPLSVACG